MSSAAPQDGNEERFDHLDDDGDPGLNIEVLRRRRELVLTFLALFLVLGSSAWAALRFVRVPKPPAGELVALAQQAAKDEWRRQDVARFGESVPARVFQFDSHDPSDIVFVDHDNYDLSGQGIGIFPGGASQPFLFTCRLSRFPDGQWRPSKLAITPL